MPTISEIVACGDKPLPRSTDVPVTVTKSQTELATSLTNAIFVTNEGPLSHGAGRVAIYSSDSADAVGVDFGTSSEAYKAASDFCSQSTRPDQFLIGQVFDTPQAGFMKTGGVEDTIATWQAVTDGSFGITIDGDTQQISALNFSGATDLDAVAAIVEAGLNAIATGGYTAATCVNDGGSFKFTSGTTGDLSTVSVLLVGSTGTDISGSDYLNGLSGTASTVPGYAPTTFTNELLLIKEASFCSGVFAYGWAFDEVYRDSQEAEDAAAFCNSNGLICSLTSNNPLAKDADSVNDIAVKLEPFGYQYVGAPEYSDYPDTYPCFAKLAVMLSVDYSGTNTVKTLKFKDLEGLPTIGVSSSEWGVLEAKGYDTFTATGNTARTAREGRMVADAWYWDERIGLDNYAEEIQVAAYNLLLKRGSLGYDADSIIDIQDALAPVNAKYKLNGLAADRQVLLSDGTIETLPAIQVDIQDLSLVTVAQRAARIGVSVQITLQLRGAMHTLPINIVAEA